MGMDGRTPASRLEDGRVMGKAAGRPWWGGDRDAPVACGRAWDDGVDGAGAVGGGIQRQFRRHMRWSQCVRYGRWLDLELRWLNLRELGVRGLELRGVELRWLKLRGERGSRERVPLVLAGRLAVPGVDD